jgi:hypothetical protein
MQCDVRVRTRRMKPPTVMAPLVRRCESGSRAELPWDPASIMVPGALWVGCAGESGVRARGALWVGCAGESGVHARGGDIEGGTCGEGVRRRGSAWEGVAMRERRQVRAREQREGGGGGDGEGRGGGGDGGGGVGDWNHGGGWQGQAKRVVARARKPIMRWRSGSSLERPMGGGRRWGVGAWAG